MFIYLFFLLPRRYSLNRKGNNQTKTNKKGGQDNKIDQRDKQNPQEENKTENNQTQTPNRGPMKPNYINLLNFAGMISGGTPRILWLNEVAILGCTADHRMVAVAEDSGLTT